MSEIPESILEKVYDLLGSAETEFELILEVPNVIVKPFTEDDYAVTLVFESEMVTLNALTWHDHFDDFDQAWACAHWLFTPYYRIVEVWKDGSRHWTFVDRYVGDRWEQIGDDVVQSSSRDIWEARHKEVFDFKIYQQCNIFDIAGFKELYPLAKLDERQFPPGTVLGCREIKNNSLRSLAEPTT